MSNLQQQKEEITNIAQKTSNAVLKDADKIRYLASVNQASDLAEIAKIKEKLLGTISANSEVIAQQAKQAADKKAALKAVEKEQLKIKLVDQLLSKYNIYIAPGQYYDIDKVTGNLIKAYNKSELPTVCPMLETANGKELMVEYAPEYYGSRRVYKAINYSWTDHDPDKINFMSKAGWLKPRSDNIDTSLLEILVESFCGGSVENVEFFMHWVGWKYLHPEDYNIPCIWNFGAGGKGKNLMAQVLRIIFGKEQVAVVRLHDQQQWNMSSLGRTIVIFDEGKEGNDKLKADEFEYLKAIVGNPTYTVKEKHLRSFENDTTASMLLFANSPDSMPKIVLDGTDRRWHCMYGNNTLNSYLCKVNGLEETKENEALMDTTKKLDVVKASQNEDIVARWLNDCIQIAKLKNETPRRMINADMQFLLEYQKDVVTEMFEDVFNDPMFTSITHKDLYEMYLNRLKDENPSATPMARNKLGNRVTAWFHNQRRTDIVKENKWNPDEKRNGTTYFKKEQ